MSSRSIDLVLDVGANEGQFAERLRIGGYSGDIVSFEPIDSVFQILQSRASRDERWQPVKLAIGDTAGVKSINIGSKTVYSSFLSSSPAGFDFDPHSAPVSQECVAVSRVDDLIEPYRKKSILLKVDTQGYEEQVLIGSSESLKIIKGILLELPIVHLYSNTWQFGDAINKMREAGFVPSQIAATNYLRNDPVSLLEVDCLFRRLDPHVDAF